MSAEEENAMPEAQSISIVGAFVFWLKLGFISFGGPVGQIAIMHQELVERRRWISEKRFLHALNYCMMLPGPEAQQLATYMGWLMHKTWGGIVAGALFVLPSLLILILLSWIYIAFGDTLVVAGMFYGIKPAVTAIVIQATYRIGSRTLRNGWLWGIAAASFVAIFALKVAFPVIVLVAAIVGYWGGRLVPGDFNNEATKRADSKSFGKAIIDDDTPQQPHTKFSWRRTVQILVVGAILWLVPMSALWLTFGWGHTFTQMSWFFTKAAFITFGGAYAVLSYLNQEAIGTYGWLSAEQMIDGLALGETTPGPLIMVVAFVAFVGGFAKAALGPDALFMGGAVAAILVTWFTFLPSFLFILIGGPLVEATHDKLGFTAPLTAITAAVVGVILNLALFFGYHVFWPEGFTMPFDWWSAMIAVAALVGLLHYKRGVIEVIAVSAMIGLVIKYLA